MPHATRVARARNRRPGSSRSRRLSGQENHVGTAPAHELVLPPTANWSAAETPVAAHPDQSTMFDDKPGVRQIAGGSVCDVPIDTLHARDQVITRGDTMGILVDPTVFRSVLAYGSVRSDGEERS